MRKNFDSLNNLNSQLDNKNNKLFVPYIDKIFVYDSENCNLLYQINNEDQILSFHLLNTSDLKIIVVSETNKKISLYDGQGEKLKE